MEIRNHDSVGFIVWTSQDSQQGHEVYLICNVSWTALGGHPDSYQWVPACFPWEWSGRGVALTTYLHLVLWLRISRSIPPLPHICLRAMHWDSLPLILVLPCKWWRGISKFMVTTSILIMGIRHYSTTKLYWVLWH